MNERILHLGLEMLGFLLYSLNLLASKVLKKVQEKQHPFPKRFRLHHVGSSVCRVIFGDVMKKCGSGILQTSVSTNSSPDKGLEGVFIAIFNVQMKAKTFSSTLVYSVLLINSPPSSPDQREEEKMLALESISQIHSSSQTFS